MILKLDEGALLAAGFSKSHVALMRHLLEQVGNLVGETTLPELASMTDGLTPRVDALTITVSATSQAVGALEADATEHAFIDGSIARRLEEMQCELEQSRMERSALARAVSDLRDEFGIVDAPAVAVPPTATTWATPGAIGSTTPNSGSFTTLISNAGGAATRQTSSAQFRLARIASSAGEGYLGADSGNAFRVFDGAFADRFRVEQGCAVVVCTATGLTSAAALTAATGFGCNGKSAQTAFALGAAATDLPTVIALANNLRTMAINNGTGS